MYTALVFQAVIAMLVLPLPLVLGVERFGLTQGEGRLGVDEQREGGEVEAMEGELGHER
jgi:FLVCR family MFS transporter 7